MEDFDIFNFTILLFHPGMLALTFPTETKEYGLVWTSNVKVLEGLKPAASSHFPDWTLLSHRKASLKLTSFPWFSVEADARKMKPWLIQMLIKEVNLGQRQNTIVSKTRHLDFVWRKERREVWSWVLPLALPLSSFHQPDFFFPQHSPNSLYALYTKSLQNRTVQLYTENIPQ